MINTPRVSGETRSDSQRQSSALRRKSAALGWQSVLILAHPPTTANATRIVRFPRASQETVALDSIVADSYFTELLRRLLQHNRPKPDFSALHPIAGLTRTSPEVADGPDAGI